MIRSASFSSILPGRLLALSAVTVGLPGQLVALAPIANDALAGEALPVRLKVLNWGENETATKGVVKVGKKTLQALNANQAALGFEEIALDYNHNSLPGHKNFQADPRKVAGYGKPEVIEGDGVYVTALSYTPSGNEHAREYRDLSPTPLLDDDGEVVFLHSVALCPQGEVKGLSFYSADFLKTKPLAMDHKKLLLTLLGLSAVATLTGLKPLSAEASDSEIETACKALADKLDKTATPVVEPTALSALVDMVKKQGEQLTALSALNETRDREAITAGALREGKIVPLSAKDLTVDQFRKLVSELPADQVPMEQRTPDQVQAFSASLTTRTADDLVREQMGISKDVWDKHNK